MNGVLSLVAGVLMLIKVKERPMLHKKKRLGYWYRSFQGQEYVVNLWLTIPITAFAGLAAGAVGISCGSFKVPLMVLACGVPMGIAVGTSSARKLTRDGVGHMFGTAGIGGRISGILKTSEAAESILAIDGCPLNCVKSSLEQAGFHTFRHLQLADLGLEKCKSPATEQNVNQVAMKATEMIGS